MADRRSVRARRSAGLKRTTFVAGAAGAAATAAAPLRARGVAAGPEVSVAYAGSLVTLMEKAVGPAFAATGFTYKGEGKGSSALAALIREGLRTPDVFISADTASVSSLMGASGHDTARWYATFAATRMQIAYSRSSKFAADFAAANAGHVAWYDVLRKPGVRIARSDPAQDPKGYRVLLVLQLAEQFYKKPGLAREVLGANGDAEPILPEEDSLARLASGEVDGVWAYSTESVARGLSSVALPPEIDLGEPRFAAEYARASVTVGARTLRGAPIVYALTIPSNAANPSGGVAFVRFLVGTRGQALMREAGLLPLPLALNGDRGAVPAPLQPLLG